MRTAAALIAAACLLAAGCETAHAPVTSRTALSRPGLSVRMSAARMPTAAGNLAAAQREAARLLPLVRVPPGAVPVARPPRSLSGPVMGAPVVTSLVDQVLAWRVARPFAVVQAWMSAHPPHGLPADGWADGGNAITGQAAMTGTSYRGPPSPAWQSADLEIGIAPDGPATSVIRADAVIVWLDPRPVPSGPGEDPLRVTLAGGCPRTDQDATGVVNPSGALSRRLLPPGQPAAGLRCLYYGLNGNTWQLRSAQRLTGQAARRAAQPIARLPLSHADGEMLNCPMDDGSAEVLALAYPGRSDIDLWIKLNGCRTVSNSHISAAIW